MLVVCRVFSMVGSASFYGFEMVGVGQPLRRVERPLPTPSNGELLVEVAGCGVCHTDLGFLYDGVKTRDELPLILGHEVSGIVRATAPGCEHLLNQAVVVPAVIPCESCSSCLSGRPMICPSQVMPGNDRDGGFASHLVVPARCVCPVPGVADEGDDIFQRSGITLAHLSVVADAVSTPYQALVRAELKAGDLCVVVGLGGVGGFAAQLASALGAHVVGLDISPQRLARAEQLGVGLSLDPSDRQARDIRKQIKDHAKQVGAPTTGWVILECYGTAAGQDLAYGLLVHGATLCVVGFTRDKVHLRLSNLMAFDARALGNWGCDPALYPDIVRMVLDGRIDLVDQVELRPLDSINEAFDDVHNHRVSRRLILTP